MHRCVLVTAAALLMMGLMVVVIVHVCQFASVVAHTPCNVFEACNGKSTTIQLACIHNS